VDGDKMMVLRSNSEKYSGFWGDEISNIEIIKIFPRDNILCNSGNYPNCGIISLFENREGFYKENFDYILIDAPTLLSVTDAAILSRFFDGFIR
jgi:hypothetical protein